MTSTEDEVKRYIGELESSAENIVNQTERFFDDAEKGLKVSGTRSPFPSTHQDARKIWKTPDGATKELQDEIRQEYEIWFAQAEELVSSHLPQRLDQFQETRDDFKEIINLNKSAKYDSDIHFNEAVDHFQEQRNVVKAIPGKIRSKKVSVRRTISKDVATGELQKARELLDDGLTRASGVIAGVALERHLLTMCEESEQELNYEYNDGISSLAQKLYEGGIIEKTTLKRLNSLGGIRNDCAHANEKEPNEYKVRTLIEDTEDYVRGRGI